MGARNGPQHGGADHRDTAELQDQPGDWADARKRPVRHGGGDRDRDPDHHTGDDGEGQRVQQDPQQADQVTAQPVVAERGQIDEVPAEPTLPRDTGDRASVERGTQTCFGHARLLPAPRRSKLRRER